MTMQCPYCQQKMEDPDDAYNQERLYQDQCPACEKEFVFRVEIHCTYEAAQADCLNDGEHQYERTQTWPREYAVMRCLLCEGERPMTPEEAAVPW